MRAVITNADYMGEGFGGVVVVDVGDGHVQSSDIALPTLRKEPEIAGGSARFVQTFGGRIGVPVPRRVVGLPLLRISPPVAWTTLSLTINADGSAERSLVGSSAFPRHWVYDENGRLIAKSAEIDYKRWLEQPSDAVTPWGAEDAREYVMDAETDLERELAREIMKSRPKVWTIRAGQRLIDQGEKERGAFLVLDGILDVYVGGQEVAAIGPGAVVGERAELEGRRSATLQARTDCRVVPFDPRTLDPHQIEELADRHRGEHT